MTDHELILKALGICACLTYNEEPQGSTKMIIRELCARLDKHVPGRVHKKTDGYLWIELCGRSRYLSWLESIKWRITGRTPDGLLSRRGYNRPKKCTQCMFGGYDKCCCDPEYTDQYQVKKSADAEFQLRGDPDWAAKILVDALSGDKDKKK